jgi:cytochrome c peroxidase
MGRNHAGRGDLRDRRETTNLKFISAVQWDGRDSKLKIVYAPTNVPSCPVGIPANLCIPQSDGTVNVIWPGTLLSDLNGTTVTATTKRLGDTIALTDPRVQQITDFETNIFTAQAIQFGAGSLLSHGASGGPQAIASFPFYIGINDPFPGGNPLGTPFTSTIFTLYDAWANSGKRGGDLRAQIARGQAVFNNTVINITGVAGINDVLGVASFKGACGTCHDTPNVGDHSVSAPLNIGIANPPDTNVLDSSYLPVYTLQNVNSASPAFGQTVTTTDPGRALITGKWADIGKFKGPILRGLASRAPYFHNGLAQSLDDVVNFYNKRFSIGFTDQQREDLVAFLSTL